MPHDLGSNPAMGDIIYSLASAVDGPWFQETLRRHSLHKVGTLNCIIN